MKALFERNRIFFYLWAVFMAVLLNVGCNRGAPELAPEKFVSPTQSRPYRVDEKTKAAEMRVEERPSVSREREPVSKTYALAKLIDIALVNNPSTRDAWERARAAAARWGASRGEYYPAITGDASGYRIGGEDSSGYYGSVGLSLSYLLLDFGGRAASVESARQALIAANWNHNQTIQDILRDVPQAYYTYLGNRAKVRASESNLKEALTSLNSTEQRKKAGVSTIADVLQVRAKVDQVRLNLVTNQGAVKTSHGNLATAVGWPANANFEVADEPEAPPLEEITHNTEKLIQFALKDRPDLASARAAVLKSEADLKKAESDLWPKLTATGNLAWSGLDADLGGYFPGGGSINDSSVNYYAGLSLQFPLFEGFSLRNSVRAAQADLEATRAVLRAKEESVISDVWTAFYDMQTAGQQLETSETLLVSSKESYRVSLARYRAGVTDIVELLNAQSTLASARAQRVQAKTDLFTSYAELLHAIGAQIPSDLPKNTSIFPDKKEASNAR
jgi:outer membrane protein